VLVGSFEILPHTADVGFRARGGSLTELFETAAMAMFAVEYEPGAVPLEYDRSVCVAGDDREDALYAWLSELIWLHDAEGFVPGRVDLRPLASSGAGLTVGGLTVQGTASGADLGAWFRQTGPQLKAVTMHGLSVLAREGGYEATVYLDV
jgi:SHS2 domain-containing protein